MLLEAEFLLRGYGTKESLVAATLPVDEAILSRLLTLNIIERNIYGLEDLGHKNIDKTFTYYVG